MVLSWRRNAYDGKRFDEVKELGVGSRVSVMWGGSGGGVDRDRPADFISGGVGGVGENDAPVEAKRSF